MDKSKMYRIIHSLRKRGGLKIDTRNRIIYYEYQSEEGKMNDKNILILCKIFGFARQAEIRD